MKALRDYSPQARHHFTRFDQVDQLVRAALADPDHGFHGPADDAVFPAPHQPWPPTSVQARQRPFHPDHDGCGSNRAALRQSLSPFVGLGLHRSGADPIPRTGSGLFALRVHASGWTWFRSGVAAGANARGCATR